MPSPPAHNSLLNLLNPYASIAQSTAAAGAKAAQNESSPKTGSPGAGLESPSTLLLRELQFDGPSRPRTRSPPTSPTPTAPQRPFVVESSSEDDEPPQSLLFPGGGARTPTARTSTIPTIGTGTGRLAVRKEKKEPSRSPGPFRRRPTPSSSSTSRHSSPARVKEPAAREHAARRESSTSRRESSTSVSASTEPPTPSSTSEEIEEPDMRIEPTPPVESKRPPMAPPAPLPERSPSPSDPPTPGTGGRTKTRGRRKYHALEQQPSVRRAGLDGYNKALWQWVNVVDLDKFLQEAYWYYKGKGVYCIALAQGLGLLTKLFVVIFSTFLVSCIDYSRLAHSAAGGTGRLGDALIGQCIVRGGVGHWLFIFAVTGWFLFEVVQLVTSIPGLRNMYNFYTYLLGVPDSDIQTMPWPEIVRRIGEIKKDNPMTSLSNGQAAALETVVGPAPANLKLDAHDIANRILRKENYLVALFNKDLLDLRVRIPVPNAVQKFLPPALLTGSPQGLPRTRQEDRKYLTFGGSTLTKAIEYNISWTIMDFFFDRRTGQVSQEIVRNRGRKDLVGRLQNRFRAAALLNLVLAPFIVPYLLLYFFFRYFEEYHKNPSSMGSRQYTQYARWRFREFNELPHLFERRLNQSYPIAKEYIDQFPKERTALVMRFVAFIAGSFAAVLFIASLIDPDLFLHFEITPHRTVLFYIGVFGSILAIARGMIPEDNLVFDPEYCMREVVQYTHYLPPEWEGKLHSQAVHTDFGQLFQLKLSVFVTEFVSVLLTPFILWFSLAPTSGAIIDFFREFTVHVDGVGYVCSFAVFDFHRPGNVGPDGAAAAAPTSDVAVPVRRRSSAAPTAPPPDSRPEAATRKMEKSVLYFKAAHPDWTPSDPNASMFLDRLMAHHPQPRGRMEGSMYHGGRGLGLGAHPMSPKSQRSNFFDPSTSPRREQGAFFDSHPAYSKHHHSPTASRLPRMEEEEDDGEAEAMGWHRTVGDDEDGEDEEDRGLLRGAGQILQQVMQR